MSKGSTLQNSQPPVTSLMAQGPSLLEEEGPCNYPNVQEPGSALIKDIHRKVSPDLHNQGLRVHSDWPNPTPITVSQHFLNAISLHTLCT